MKNIFLLIFFIAVIASCNNDPFNFNSSQKLIFSSDTVSFDTVFTSFGSATKSLVVKNTSNKNILIKTIRVPNDFTFFSLNIDGLSKNKAENIEILPNDSIYIFAKVKIDPLNATNPVLIEDSIIFEMEDTIQSVKLLAFGQDVHLIKSAFIETTVWDSKKPYLIMDSLNVLANFTLTIGKGVTVYCHKKAKINVFGNIVAQGTIEEPVTFRGERLDEIWEDYKYDYSTAQWDGITIFPSKKTSLFENCVIKNATTGLYTGDGYSDETAKVNLLNTIIHNNSFSGVYSINSELVFKNCQITNSGTYNVFLIAGGDYHFYHCTIANYYGMDFGVKREEVPCLSITNAVSDGKVIIYNPLTKASFYNCIIDGNQKNEIIFQRLDDIAFNFKFSNCALKVDESIKNDFKENFENCYFNDTIKYLIIKEWKYSFQLDTNSFAIDKGRPENVFLTEGLETDLVGNSRLKDEHPDLGAYEFKK